MFTGLIEDVGRVADVAATAAGFRLAVRTTLGDLAPGDSLAVNGVCLTVTTLAEGVVHADIGPETARITTLGRLRSGQTVNLERSMRADRRFGGHFVQGHVDATGTITALREQGDAHWVSVRFPNELSPYFVRKGSVAVDGISLTIAELGGEQFDVMIIPFTWSHTNLASAAVGGQVNLECDIVGKYVARAVQVFGSP